MKARIFLANGTLYADLENGLRLSHVDAIELADQLWNHSVTHEQLSLLDWHEDPEHAPLAGQKIAIHCRLRLQENGSE